MIARFVSYILSQPLPVKLYSDSQTRCIDIRVARLISIEVCPVLIPVEGEVP
jgi:hypothetical protein